MANADPRQKSFGARLVASLLRALLIAFLCGLFIFLFVRMWQLDSMPKAVKKLSINEKMLSAYGQTDGTAETEAFTQSYGLFTYNDEAYGYFAAPAAYFFPEADQLQVVVRYNISTLKKIAADKGLEKVPGREEDIFDFSVVLTDTAGTEKRYHPAETVTYDRGLYCYRRFTFYGAVPSETTEGVFIDFYYMGNDGVPNYEELPLGAICLYENVSDNIPYAFTKSDRDVLSAATVE